MKVEDDSGLTEVGPEDGYLLVRIHVPELNVQKCLQFPRDQLVWDVKQQCLAALPKVAMWFRELKESFNYGLFSPPQNGKAGKFLDEERRLGDYPFNGPVGYLELKYKKRVYKMLNVDEKALKSLHTRANYRRFLEYVNNAQVEKITKMCSKGFDPNFHCADTGETPLTLATGIKKPGKVLIALVNGGALLDYRTKDGATALHRAVDHNSLEALTTLLELGASPNYKDAKGLTPLYLCVTNKSDPMLCETLLHDHAAIGAQDLQGWRESHQACRNGMVTHLEHILFYGADMNVRNASGNTPLHVCAVNNQESCARLLLFRGCDKEALNYANQTPYQVAVIAGNLELAEIIQSHRPEEVVPFREPPRYKPGRRGSRKSYQGDQRVETPGRLPSPSLSLRSLCPFSSASSSLSETSSASGGSNSASYTSNNTDKSLGDASDIISDSSGVGTSSSDTTNLSIAIPGTTVVCIENSNTGLPGHLNISQGDILEVTGGTEDGYLEGTLRNQGTGLFPARCVQEVRLRTNPNIPLALQGHELNSVVPQRSASSSRVQGRREIQKHFATAPRLKKILPAEPRTVILHRARKGFGFVLRGAKALSPLMELTPNSRCPGLQYLDDVDKGGIADMAGLQKGDYLLAINGEDVSAASHERVVELIRKSGDLVQMTVVSAGSPSGVPSSKSTINIAGVPPGRGYATLPRKLNNTLGRSAAPLPPRRDPKTTLSVGRARAKSMISGGEEEDIENALHCLNAETFQHLEPGNSTNCQPRTASVRARPISSRITTTELEELFQRQRGHTQKPGIITTSDFYKSSSNPGSPAKTPRVYASVAEMKRSKIKGSTNFRFFLKNSKSNMAELHRDFHSTPDLAIPQISAPSDVSNGKPHRSQEDLGLLFRPLPPSYPPPPIPPTGQIVKVETRLSTTEQGGILVSKGEYVAAKSGKGKGGENGEVMSSFRPSDNAKLYASPEDMKTVGFRSRPSIRKSHSLRSPPKTAVLSTDGTEEAQIMADDSAQYAQPFRQAPNGCGTISDGGGGNKRHSLTMSRLTNPPPIPEPDYSFSESDEEDVSQNNVINLAMNKTNAVGSNSNTSSTVPVNTVSNNSKGQERETNENENSSASSSGTIAHSFSVEEIQKVRTKLKSSKSYPNDFIVQQNVDGDGDNSSSGVSSDQDVPGGPQGCDDPDIRPAQPFQRQNSIRISNKTMMNRQKTLQLERNFVGRRNIVSLAHLPPPIEDSGDDSGEGPVVPPPPEFLTGNGTEMEVLAPPPPQFSDGKMVTRVRIVGAVPKAKAAPTGSGTGKCHSTASPSSSFQESPPPPYSFQDHKGEKFNGEFMPSESDFNETVLRKYSYYSQIRKK